MHFRFTHAAALAALAAALTVSNSALAQTAAPAPETSPITANVTLNATLARAALNLNGAWNGSIGLTIVVCLGSAIYALSTWEEPNRQLILAVIGAGLLSAPLVHFLPWDRIVRSRWRSIRGQVWPVSAPRSPPRRSPTRGTRFAPG